MLKRFFVLILILFPVCETNSETLSRPRPNFLIIITDDQRYDTLTPEIMPRTWQRIVHEGTLFQNAFVTTPLCCPSRASIFTGMIARDHGVLRNKTNSDRVAFARMNHFPEDLKKNGYKTALVGKFLNSWSGRWEERRREEFDYWASIDLLPGHVSNSYFNFDLHLKKKLIPYRCTDAQFAGCKYVTDEMVRYTLPFLNQVAESGQPFLLYFAPTAPHDPATPALRHAALFPDLPPYRPPSYAEKDLSDKPKWLREAGWIKKDSEGQPFMDSETSESIDNLRLAQLRSLAALDEAIGTILDFLQSHGLLDQTFVLFTSDNGIHLGEHFLEGKNAPYEESIRVPFAVRFPPLRPIDSARVNSENLIANIDMAPTIYELAELDSPAQLAGQSLVPLIAGRKNDWRKTLFFEGWPDRPGDIGNPEQCRPPFRAIRSKHYIYIRYESNTGTGAPCVFSNADGPELYDLVNDPYQMENVAKRAEYKSVVNRLEKKLRVYPKVDAPVRFRRRIH